MADITKQLETINIKFSSRAKPLKKLAFSDLALKGLFLANRPIGISELAKEVAKIIGFPNVDEKLIEEALDMLVAENKITLNQKTWLLKKEVREQIEKEIKTSEELLENVLKRNFSTKIDVNIMKGWFFEAIADFFSFHSEEWVKSVCKKIDANFSRSVTIKELLLKSIAKHSLLKSQGELISGFIGFLESNDPDDQKYIMNTGFAMFSCKLVSADVGADPVTIDELRDAVFILDTNILIAMNLDGHRLSKSIAPLGKALSQINSRIIYLHVTKMEYERVCQGAKARTLGLFKIYPEEVIFDAQDDFIKTAKNRKCKTKEDFERFFDEMKINIPEKIESGPKISEWDYPEFEVVKKKAETDASLKVSLQTTYRRLQHSGDEIKEKTPASINHDTALIHIAESIKDKEHKTWILTLDRSLQACSIERAGQHSMPIAIFLEGLIQILAISNGGPNQDASNFAPLLTSIMIKRCTPPERTYTPQDLQWLYSMQERVVDFAPVRIKKILTVVTQNRFAGMTTDDERMKRDVDRAYQEEKRAYEQELEEIRVQKRSAEEETDKISQRLTSTEIELKKMKRSDFLRKARNKLMKDLLWRVPLAVAVTAIVFHLATLALDSVAKSALLDTFISTVAGFGIAFGLLKKPVQNYIVSKKEINSF